MANRDVCEVTIAFAKEDGGMRVTASDAIIWVEELLAGRVADGPNGLRHAEGRITALRIRDKDDVWS
jgi:hypothetical protein